MDLGLASFASEGTAQIGKRIGLGEGVLGQCAVEKRKIMLDNLPAGVSLFEASGDIIDIIGWDIEFFS